MSVWSECIGEHCVERLRRRVGACASAAAGGREVQPNTAALAAIDEAAFNEPQPLQPGRNLTERLLGLRRASGDLGDWPRRHSRAAVALRSAGLSGR